MILLLTGALIVIASQIVRFRLLAVRGFDPDELEHAHGAWLIHTGWLPFRDYFEHHLPGLHYLLAPLFSFFQVETDPESAFAWLRLARGVSWVGAAAILGLTFSLGRLRGGTRVGVIAAALLAGTQIFLDKSVEIRPDVAAVALWLGALLLVLRPAGSRFLLAGVLLGLATLFTQKMLFAVPGLALAVLLDRRGSGFRWRDVSRAGLGFVLPLALTCIWFAAHGAFEVFVQQNFLMNAAWSARLHPLLLLADFALSSPVVALLGMFGLALGLRRAVAGVRNDGRVSGDRLATDPRFHKAFPCDLLVPLCALGPMLGLAVIPIAWPQYYLIFLPLLAILAAEVLTGAVDRIVRQDRLRAPILAGLLAAASLPAAVQHQRAFAWSNAADLRAIRYVIESSAPEEQVLDGWSGAGVFRPHAWYFFFLHPEIIAMLGPVEISDLHRRLVSGAIAPRLVVLDDHLRGLSPEITEFLRASYAPVGVGDIWARRTDPSPPKLIGP